VEQAIQGSIDLCSETDKLSLNPSQLEIPFLKQEMALEVVECWNIREVEYAFRLAEFNREVYGHSKAHHNDRSRASS
jgi:hypothetical protein